VGEMGQYGWNGLIWVKWGNMCGVRYYGWNSLILVEYGDMDRMP